MKMVMRNRVDSGAVVAWKSWCKIEMEIEVVRL